MVDHNRPRIKIGPDGTIRVDDKDKKSTNVRVGADGTIHVGDGGSSQAATSSRGVTQGDYHVLTCPHCGERLRAIEPSRDVTVEIDCPTCHKTSYFHLSATPEATPPPEQKQEAEKGNGCLVSIIFGAFAGGIGWTICGMLGIPLPPDIVG